MRFLILLVALALVAVVVVLLLYAFAGRGERPGTAQDTRWQTHTESRDGVTTVLVRQVTLDASGAVLAELGRQSVAAIPDDDPDWETRYHQAMAEARSRVAALDIQRD